MRYRTRCAPVVSATSDLPVASSGAKSRVANDRSATPEDAIGHALLRGSVAQSLSHLECVPNFVRGRVDAQPAPPVKLDPTQRGRWE